MSDIPSPIPEPEPKRHHVWCNFWTRPVETCTMCAGLRKDYPEDCSEDELMMRHFPDNIKRT